MFFDRFCLVHSRCILSTLFQNVVLKKAQQEKEAALQEKERGIAKMLLLQGIDIETIAKATTLSIEEIEKLRS